MPQIKDLSFTSNNVPFSMNQSNTNVGDDKHKKVMSNVYGAEEDFIKVLGIKLKSGRWITEADAALGSRVVVINNRLQQELFEGKDAVGKSLGSDAEPMKIIGVIEDIKDRGSYQDVESGIYKPMDSNWARWTGTILLKVQPGADAAFEGKLFKSLSNTIGTSIEIEHLDKKLESKNKIMLIPMIIAFVVGGFLIINVALGLFGVLWYNINRRRGEIGLRRAVGATGNSVAKQLVGEAMVLATISLILGCFFAFQFPLLNVFDLSAGIYLVAIALSVIFIYMLVTICAVYPGKQAAAIYPAVALHED
jgi:putative ABC transport system permease protein